MERAQAALDLTAERRDIEQVERSLQPAAQIWFDAEARRKAKVAVNDSEQF